jgi:hypothetical protein
MLRKRLKTQIPTATPVAANSGYTCAEAKKGISEQKKKSERDLDGRVGSGRAELTSGRTHLLAAAIGVAWMRLRRRRRRKREGKVERRRRVRRGEDSGRSA